MGGLLVRYFPVAAELHTLHGEHAAVRAGRWNRDHRNDFSVHDEDPGAGVELRGAAGAGFVCDVPDVVTAAVGAAHRVGDADGALVRGHARNPGRQGLFGGALLVGRGTQRGVLRSGDYFLRLDFRAVAHERTAGQAGLVVMEE